MLRTSGKSNSRTSQRQKNQFSKKGRSWQKERKIPERGKEGSCGSLNCHLGRTASIHQRTHYFLGASHSSKLRKIPRRKRAKEEIHKSASPEGKARFPTPPSKGRVEKGRCELGIVIRKWLKEDRRPLKFFRGGLTKPRRKKKECQHGS